MTLRDLKSFHHKHDSLSTCTVHIWFLLVCNVHSMQYFQIQFWSSRGCADNNDRFWSGGPGQARQAFGLGPCFMPQLWRPCPLLPNGCTDQDSTWYGGWPRLRPQCAWYGPSSPHGKGHSSPPTFPRISYVVVQGSCAWCTDAGLPASVLQAHEPCTTT